MSFLRGILDWMFPARKSEIPDVDRDVVRRTSTTTALALQRNSLLRAELSALESRLRDRAGGKELRNGGMAR